MSDIPTLKEFEHIREHPVNTNSIEVVSILSDPEEEYIKCKDMLNKWGIEYDNIDSFEHPYFNNLADVIVLSIGNRVLNECDSKLVESVVKTFVTSAMFNRKCKYVFASTMLDYLLRQECEELGYTPSNVFTSFRELRSSLIN